ncbi:MAG: hypothetical protein DRP11_01085 [Candidatus Aenigmatarchaeota archaeon]|nr:MAG: hypothetical protein DRP11_01085 [Candidatus Aenigmarchaeota archaeon]
MRWILFAILFILISENVLASCNYDVIIKNKNVEQEDYLQVSVLLQNKLDRRQQAQVEYQVIGTRVWFDESEATVLYPTESKNLTKEIYIYTAQDPGEYILNTTITCGFDIYVVEKNFTVFERGALKQNEGKKETKPLMITSIPDTVRTISGEPVSFLVSFKNFGDHDLSDVSIKLDNIDKSWYNIKNPVIPTLPQQESNSFNITITPPSSTDEQLKSIRVTIFSDTFSDSESVTLRIFATKEGYIDFELARLEDKLYELKTASAALNEEDIKESLNEAEAEIKNAKIDYNQTDYDTAIERLKKVDEILKNVDEYIKEKESEIGGSIFLPLVDIWNIIISYWIFLLIPVAGAGAFLLFKRFSPKKTEEKTEPQPVQSPAPPRNEATEIKKIIQPPQMDKEKERRKIEGVLNILNNQYKNNLISEKAYKEMKELYERKLRELSKE